MNDFNKENEMKDGNWDGLGVRQRYTHWLPEIKLQPLFIFLY